ncbi:MAG TPA: hypothetical protein VLR45_05750, partial [Desulfoprunum sp.]|nr:hypothetical protein [Desulfoprunum sp.]
MFVEYNSVTLEGLPLDIPDQFSLEVTDLKIGDHMTFGDISLSPSLKLISKADTVCVKVGKKINV